MDIGGGLPGREETVYEGVINQLPQTIIDIFNTKNTSNQSLLIHTGQVKFGMYYTMDKKRDKKEKDTDNTSKSSGIDVTPILNNK